MNRSLALALTGLLALASGNSARAASVTYEFIEVLDGSGAGVVGGLLQFASPPASSTSDWSMAATAQQEANILDFEILDSKVGIVGSYLFPQFFGGFASTTMGQSLNSGSYGAYMAPGTFPSAFTYASPGFQGLSQLGGFDAGGISIGSAYGRWTLVSSAVPEPSSVVLLGLGALGLLGAVRRSRADR